MIRNGKDVADGSVISTQVCVIGSGPAGVTAAWYLQRAGIKVTLIEGSRDYRNAPVQASWPDKVKLYNGVADGVFATNEAGFLILPDVEHTSPAWERERIYGGTSAHWGGQSRPLDPITFQKRPGFPGWPISRKELDPHYREAASFCKLYSDNFTAAYWAQVLQAEAPSLEGFDTDMHQFVGGSYLNFSTRPFDGKPIGNSLVEVILNASLLTIDHDVHGVVRGLRVASMDDQPVPQKATEFTIRATAFVLACGAVANARQLLLSKAGNQHGEVGRNFMCQPLTTITAVSPQGYLSAAESRLMNGQTANGVGWHDANGVGVTGRFSPNAEAQLKYGIGSCSFWPAAGQYCYEMSPNPDSRITLADTRDPVFGQQQTRITWQLGPLDAKTYNHATELFKAAVTKRGGSVSFVSWDDVKSHLVVNGHHIGTTRMSDDPTQGVVDANLKVHSLNNLYVAGSSVFPSTGISSPTFTIIALSIRLAKYLSGTLS